MIILGSFIIKEAYKIFKFGLSQCILLANFLQESRKVSSIDIGFVFIKWISLRASHPISLKMEMRKETLTLFEDIISNQDATLNL